MGKNKCCLDCKCDISNKRIDAKRCNICYIKRKNERRYLKHRLKLLYKRSLGTGELKEHRNNNFNTEHKLIQKEKKRLGLVD